MHKKYEAGLSPHLKLQARRAMQFLSSIWILTATCLVVLPLTLSATGKENIPPKRSLAAVTQYISTTWGILSRSMKDCRTVVDPKFKGKSVLYLPAQYTAPAPINDLPTRCNIRVDHLPAIESFGKVDFSLLSAQGLLFLENDYVVPGGRFNEMYYEDTYFIIRGLLREGKAELARGMLENLFFEIEHYGAPLNANRVYNLTTSQPPFLTSMILAVYSADKSPNEEKQKWLERAYSYAVRDYKMWTTDPHLGGDTGLSRYYELGEGPAAGVLADEPSYYPSVVAFFLKQPEIADQNLVDLTSDTESRAATGPAFVLQLCDASQQDSHCQRVKMLSLSRDFYKGDRTVREAAYDISFRFGPFGSKTHHYVPVCLNSLLYKAETDLAKMSALLGKGDEADEWRKHADDRKQKVTQYLWDSAKGMFFDYDFVTKTRSSYNFATTFFPLWAGLATDSQAKAVMNNLATFEQAGGLAMSTTPSGAQWDYPYGWAPIQLLATDGMRRYGYNEEANRIAYKFLSMVAENFFRDGTIHEKYDVVKRSSQTDVVAGYAANVSGFGWTNGVFLELLHVLPIPLVDHLATELSATSARDISELGK